MTETTVAVEGVLDIATLLQPIPGDLPAGDDRAYAYGLRDTLIELRREERAEDFDDATRPEVLKRADWHGVYATTCTALEQTTKDLRVVCHLIEALAHLRGFQGLHEGLQLLRELVETCWDRLVPSIDDGDLDARCAPLANMLDDPSRGICFPLTVKSIPLVGSGKFQYGLLQWQKAKEARDDKIEEHLTQAVVETPVAALEATVDAIHGCEEELSRLCAELDDKCGPDAPALTHLGDSLAECCQLVQQGFLSMAQTGPTESPPTDDSPASGPVVCAGPASQVSSPQALRTRNEAYSQLRRAADTLQKLEPHSPIPYLVKRAVQLGQLPFPKLIEKLIRNGDILAELDREFGLGGELENGSSANL